jgi:predicted ATPase
LLLDYAEHLLPGAVGAIAELSTLEKAVVLVTSRARLHVRAEHVVSVSSMEEDDAVRLFVARALQVDSSFRESSAVADLCRRLDDLPLAIELAAARTTIFSVQELLERLGETLDLLRGPRDADPRQQTLRATIEWSHGLLNERQQRLFARLSIFVGGCTYGAAEVVCGADPDTLESLIDESLVRRRETPDGSRYWMLETIREHAAEQLASGDDAADVRAAHATYFAAFAEQASPHLQHGPDQLGWADRVALEYDNIRSAMRFGLTEEPEVAQRIVAGIAFFVWIRGGFAEARAWVEEALTAGGDTSLLWHGRALACAAIIAERHGDLAAERRYADDAYAGAAAAVTASA